MLEDGGHAHQADAGAREAVVHGVVLGRVRGGDCGQSPVRFGRLQPVAGLAHLLLRVE